MVHDLRSLAGRLDLLLQNLEERYDDPLFKQTVVDVLDGTVGHLQRLAGELRDHDGRLMVKLRVDLNAILDQALDDVRPDLGRTIRLQQEMVELPAIWGDALLLRCAFVCAIENAMEAMEDNGVLSIATELHRRRNRERITVEIGDTGAGMTREFLRERLFQPLATTKAAGLGLGAYTFRQVVALHGGTVRILSKEHVGTRVRFHFPV